MEGKVREPQSGHRIISQRPESISRRPASISQRPESISRVENFNLRDFSPSFEFRLIVNFLQLTFFLGAFFGFLSFFCTFNVSPKETLNSTPLINEYMYTKIQKHKIRDEKCIKSCIPLPSPCGKDFRAFQEESKNNKKKRKTTKRKREEKREIRKKRRNKEKVKIKLVFV